MSLRKLIFVSVFTIVISGVAAAQGVYSPKTGSAERTAILGALRIPVERTLKQKIVFVTDHFNANGTWAFVSGRPMTPSGGKPSLKGTIFDGAEDMFDDNFFGLLRKTGGKWRVVTHALGCTDVCYLDWWEKYKAPKSIFPYTE